MRLPTILVTGPVGVGKTTLITEMSGVLSAANIPNAAVDLDQLTECYPLPAGDDKWGTKLGLANLAAIWRNYRDCGADHLLIARVIESRLELDGYRAAVPGADITLVRLRASPKTLQARVRRRGPGAGMHWHLDRAVELAASMESTTQIPHFVQLFAAINLGFSQNRVRVIAPELGGGFGSKLNVYAEELLVPFLAKTLGRPVKWTEERREGYLSTTHGRDLVPEAEIAAKRDVPRRVRPWKGRPCGLPPTTSHALERERYVADGNLALTIFLALCLRKPVFLVGGWVVNSELGAFRLRSVAEVRLLACSARLPCRRGDRTAPAPER